MANTVAIPRRLRAALLLALACLSLTTWAADPDDGGLSLLMPPKPQSGGSRLMDSALAHTWGTSSADDTLVPLNRDWAMLSRTSVSSAQTDLLPGSNPYGGGESVRNVWLAPTKVAPDNAIVAAGTAFLSNDPRNNLAGSNRWGAGPSAVMLMQHNEWQWGVQASHIWSYATPGLYAPRASNSVSAMQPFLAYTQKTGYTWTVGSDSTYDWTGHNLAVPVSAGVSKQFTVGTQKANVGLEGKYWMTHPDSMPGWGVRLTASVLFPD